MKQLIWIILAATVGMVSCSRSEHHAGIINEAGLLAPIYPDSALTLLSAVEPSELKEDSLKALYYLATASAHKAKESSMASDSLIRFSFEYYRNHRHPEFVKSADLYALYRFWTGDGKGSLKLLDSVMSLPGIPDSLMIQLLQSRIGIGGQEYDCQRNIAYIKKLQNLDRDSVNQLYYKYQLCVNYQFAGQRDSSLILIDELIDYSRSHHITDELSEYEYEKIGVLEEIGRYDESNAQVDYFLNQNPHPSSLPYLRFWKALNYFNKGDYGRATRELAVADSCAGSRDDVDLRYYESFAGPLREFLEYRQRGFITLRQMATLNNSQRERFNRMESTRRETEQNVLRQENRALSLKMENERKTAIIVVVLLLAVIVSLIAVWSVRKRKRAIIEAEERAETLQKMVDEMASPATAAAGQESLRRAMLQQLGIIRMVAETPTEQNREMLRKISSIDSDTNGALVNWKNVYDIIDNLYSNAYSCLHERYGGVLTEKEEQIIVLMMAGFSTKEISVITQQTTATIYVRKSSVRKKLGVPEKEDIVAFLRQEGNC